MDVTFQYSSHDPVVAFFERNRPRYRNSYKDFCSLRDYINFHDSLLELKNSSREGIQVYFAGLTSLILVIVGLIGIVFCGVVSWMHNFNISELAIYSLSVAIFVCLLGTCTSMMVSICAKRKVTKFNQELDNIKLEFRKRHPRITIRSIVITDKASYCYDVISSFSVNLLADGEMPGEDEIIKLELVR